MKIKLTILLVAVCLLGIFTVLKPRSLYVSEFYPLSADARSIFGAKVIDTMKTSRDRAEEKLYSTSFKTTIDAQMRLIADAGATHVAIGTPYDSKFLPYLKRWVESAREHGLKVWFRGNFSGWEGWFSYQKIDRVTHKALLRNFLEKNPNLFESGDIFSPCPECENGGPGDPRMTGDRNGYNKFLIDEYKIANEAFRLMGKKVDVYFSMNGDIARDIIDKATVQAVDGSILVDHYVNTPKKFADDIQAMSKKLGVRVGVGEFGAPIPDLNGSLTQSAQAQYVAGMFENLYKIGEDVPVINYWVLTGGSTALINENGSPREVYNVVKQYFTLPKVTGRISDPLGESLSGVSIKVQNTEYIRESESDGSYAIFLAPKYKNISLKKDGYETITFDFPADASGTIYQDFVLKPVSPSLWYRIKVEIKSLRSRIFTNSEQVK